MSIAKSVPARKDPLEIRIEGDFSELKAGQRITISGSGTVKALHQSDGKQTEYGWTEPSYVSLTLSNVSVDPVGEPQKDSTGRTMFEFPGMKKTEA